MLQSSPRARRLTCARHSRRMFAADNFADTAAGRWKDRRLVASAMRSPSLKPSPIAACSSTPKTASCCTSPGTDVVDAATGKPHRRLFPRTPPLVRVNNRLRGVDRRRSRRVRLDGRPIPTSASQPPKPSPNRANASRPASASMPLSQAETDARVKASLVTRPRHASCLIATAASARDQIAAIAALAEPH